MRYAFVALAAVIAGCGDSPPELPPERATPAAGALAQELAASLRAEFETTVGDIEVDEATCRKGDGRRYVCRVQERTAYTVTLAEDRCWTAELQPDPGLRPNPRLATLQGCLD